MFRAIICPRALLCALECARVLFVVCVGALASRLFEQGRLLACVCGRVFVCVFGFVNALARVRVWGEARSRAQRLLCVRLSYDKSVEPWAHEGMGSNPKHHPVAW